jgi:hypothetical protein
MLSPAGLGYMIARFSMVRRGLPCGGASLSARGVTGHGKKDNAMIEELLSIY